jgi:hypothetical protein
MSISTVAEVVYTLVILGIFVSVFGGLIWLIFDLIRDARNDRRNSSNGQGFTAVSRLLRKSQQEAESMAKTGSVVHETVRLDAGPCMGLGAYLGHVRLYRTADGIYHVTSELWLSSLPRRFASTDWSGLVTRAEGIRAYYDALDGWYGRDDRADGANEISAHTAPIDHGHDLVAVHAALAADLDLNDLDLTVGSLPARILHAAFSAGYDADEIRVLDLTDEDLLPQLTVAAALNQPAR